MTITAGELRKAVLDELKSLGFEWEEGELCLADEQTKPLARRLHEPAKEVELGRRQDWLRREQALAHDVH